MVPLAALPSPCFTSPIFLRTPTAHRAEPRRVLGQRPTLAPALAACYFYGRAGLRRRFRAVQMREPVAQEALALALPSEGDHGRRRWPRCCEATPAALCRAG